MRDFKVIGQKRVDQREIGTKRFFEEIFGPVHVNFPLSLFDHGADTGCSQDAAEAVTSSPDAFRKGTLRTSSIDI